MGQPGAGENSDELAHIDEIAALLVASDSGDSQAEADLARRYTEDARLHPGGHVQRFSPYGEPPVVEEAEPRRLPSR